MLVAVCHKNHKNITFNGQFTNKMATRVLYSDIHSLQLVESSFASPQGNDPKHTSR